MDDQLARWRADTPGCAHRIHLNNAGAALMPKPVVDAVMAHLQRETDCGGYESSDAAEEKIAEAYAHLARLVAAHTRNIAIVENATVAFFQAFSAFTFTPGHSF